MEMATTKKGDLTMDEAKLVCANPFRLRSKSHDDIEVMVVVRGRLLPICKKCWKKLGKSDQEWFNPDW